MNTYDFDDISIHEFRLAKLFLKKILTKKRILRKKYIKRHRNTVNFKLIEIKQKKFYF